MVYIDKALWLFNLHRFCCLTQFTPHYQNEYNKKQTFQLYTFCWQHLTFPYMEYEHKG